MALKDKKGKEGAEAPFDVTASTKRSAQSLVSVTLPLYLTYKSHVRPVLGRFSCPFELAE